VRVLLVLVLLVRVLLRGVLGYLVWVLVLRERWLVVLPAISWTHSVDLVLLSLGV
jgi:hypothetical protein